MRVMAVMMATVGGLGVAVYALAWALIPVAPDSEQVGRRAGAWREAPLIVLAVAALFAGVHLAGSHVGEGLWPLVLGVCGMALLWRPAAVADGSPSQRRRTLSRATAPSERARRPARDSRARCSWRSLPPRCCTRSASSTASARRSGPSRSSRLCSVWWSVRGCCASARSLSFERAARIREQERAEVAAHLHDSVLQTLALIQKRAGDPREVAGLARRRSASCAAGCWSVRTERGQDERGERRSSARRRRSRSCTGCRSRSSRSATAR